MRVFKAILSNVTVSENWILIIRKTYKKSSWKIKGIRISDGFETESQEIYGTNPFSAVMSWIQTRPGNLSLLTCGEIKL